MTTNKNMKCCGGKKTTICTTSEEFGNVMCNIEPGSRLYIGGRYIWKFSDPIDWNQDTPYELYTVVRHNTFTYVSKKAVPAGIEIDNEEFWFLISDPNAQFEELRQLVEEYIETVNTFDERINSINDNVMSTLDNTITPFIIGRDVLSYEKNTLQFSAVVKHDNNFYAFYPNNYDNKTYLKLYKADGTIIDKGIEDNGHANSAAYIDSTNKIICSWLTEYNNGTGTSSNKISEYNSNFELERIVNLNYSYYAVSYDSQTDKLYGFVSSGNVITIHLLENTTYEVLETIGEIDSNFISNRLLQDIAVNNNYAFIATTDNVIYKFNLTDFELEKTYSVNAFDNQNTFRLQEPQALEFDSNGELIQAFCNYISNGLVLGFTTSLNGYAETSNTYTTVSANRTVWAGRDNKWNRLPWDLKSLAEVNAFITEVAKVEIETNFIDPAKLHIDLNKGIAIVIRNGAKLTTGILNLASGVYQLYIEDNGEYVNTAVNANHIQLQNYMDAFFTLNNRGTITTPNNENFVIVAGFSKIPVVIGNTGTVNPGVIKVDTITAEANTMYIGQYFRVRSSNE